MNGLRLGGDIGFSLQRNSFQIGVQEEIPPYQYAYDNGLLRLLRAGTDAAVQVDFFSVSVDAFRLNLAFLVLCENVV